jgi:DNA helicase-2/ATP-dependent DNA helicase PcrA
MPPEIEELLASAKGPVSVTAAAGCGKTEAIVKAVRLAEGKQLVLTHTNAGVAALRARLRKYQVPASKFRVETIASWLLKYAAAYPGMSGLRNPRPQGDEWDEAYPAAAALFDHRFVSDVVKATYCGVFVDEYQDCTKSQHALVLRLAEFLPVRVIGDPLQGIFGFQQDPLVDWSTDVAPNFCPYPDALTTPYRWQDTNPQLGAWLGQVRERLQDGQAIELRDNHVAEWRQWSDSAEEACLRALRSHKGTKAGIHQWPKDAQYSARRIGGEYQSIEEMDCSALMKAAARLDKGMASGAGTAMAISVINFIRDCAAVGDCFQEVLRAIQEKRVELLPRISDQQLGSAFHRLVSNRDLGAIAEIVNRLASDRRVAVYRRELLTEMRRAALEYATGRYESFCEAAYTARYRTRVNGRPPENRVISTTLLIKGLEFDHAIVLHADQFQNKENFYVAVTRGSWSLTILSENPIIGFARPGSQGPVHVPASPG